MQILLLFSFSSLVASSLASSLRPRAQCDANDCLRALRRHDTSASPFCSTYIAPSTLTVTASTTRTVYSIVNSSATTPLPAIPSSLTAPTPTYATPCTDTTRLSSACSCLLSTNAPTAAAVATLTIPAAVTTIPVCDPAAPNNGIAYQRGAFEDLINVATQQSNTTDPHLCCASCYATPGCLTYSLGFNASSAAAAAAAAAVGNGTQGGLVGDRQCVLSVAVEGSVSGPRVDGTCPYGVYLAFNGKGEEVGLGPCVDYRGPGE